MYTGKKRIYMGEMSKCRIYLEGRLKSNKYGIQSKLITSSITLKHFLSETKHTERH